jgi:hypothetical protein
VQPPPQTIDPESLLGLIGRLPDPATDREALTILRDREHLDARWLAKRVQGRRNLYRRPLRELFPGLDAVRSSLAGNLSVRPRRRLAAAGIESWSELAGESPIALRHLPEVGLGAVEEILLLAMSEWASAFLAASGQYGSRPSPTGDLLLDLIGRTPDPVDDASSLRSLLDPDEAAIRRFCEGLCQGERREWPLREQLPGLDLVESPTFSDHLDVRAANALGRVGSLRLSNLATTSPARLIDVPGIGAGTIQLILAAITREWAAAYLRAGDGAEGTDRGANGEGPLKPASSEGLVDAFEKLEGLAAFETFRQRQLDDDPPSVRDLAMRLGVSTQLIYEKEARIERVLASRMREDDWPIRIAVEEMRERLGSVASLRDLDEAREAIDSRALPSHLPHRVPLLLKLGSYQVKGEWVLDHDIEALTGAVLAAALGNSSDDVDAVARHLSRLGIREELQLPWLTSRHGFKIVDGRLIALI